MQNTESKITLLRDKEWDVFYKELCLVTDFCPLATIKNGKVITLGASTPYAAVDLKCRKFTGTIKGFITHKLDFMHLWHAFKDRTVKENEEVIIVWLKGYYKGFANLFSFAMPKLEIMICKKDAYNLMTDQNFKPELQGEARFLAEKPIVDLKLDVMK